MSQLGVLQANCTVYPVTLSHPRQETAHRLKRDKHQHHTTGNRAWWSEQRIHFSKAGSFPSIVWVIFYEMPVYQWYVLIYRQFPIRKHQCQLEHIIVSIELGFVAIWHFVVSAKNCFLYGCFLLKLILIHRENFMQYISQWCWLSRFPVADQKSNVFSMVFLMTRQFFFGCLYYICYHSDEIVYSNTKIISIVVHICCCLNQNRTNGHVVTKT